MCTDRNCKCSKKSKVSKKTKKSSEPKLDGFAVAMCMMKMREAEKAEKRSKFIKIGCVATTLVAIGVAIGLVVKK